MIVFLESPSTYAPWNLALEQYVFDCMDRDKAYFMLWQNENTIVVGKNQNTFTEINRQFVEKNHTCVVRRLSGGGAVYHDLGNLNFTFITDSASNGIDFETFCMPIIRTLKTFGVDAELSGRNDILVAGKKFSGNSQYSKEQRVMHHGTILFSSNLSLLSHALQVSKEKFIGKGVQSVESRVANLAEYLPVGTTLTMFKSRLLSEITRTNEVSSYTLTEADRTAIDALSKERYETWEWTYGSSPTCSFVNRCRITDCGTIEISLDISHGKISQLYFHGDYFGNGDTADLAKKLLTCPYDKGSILSRLHDCDVGNYIHNMTAGQLADIILSQEQTTIE